MQNLPFMYLLKALLLWNLSLSRKFCTTYFSELFSYILETYQELSQTSTEGFNGWKPITIVGKCSILTVCRNSEQTSGDDVYTHQENIFKFM